MGFYSVHGETPTASIAVISMINMNYISPKIMGWWTFTFGAHNCCRPIANADGYFPELMFEPGRDSWDLEIIPFDRAEAEPLRERDAEQ